MMTVLQQLLCFVVIIVAFASRGSHSASMMAVHLENDMETADMQHINQDLAELASGSQAGNESSLDLEALMQQNRLTPVIRYAGAGYNIIKGNPEGDFTKGGTDPGIRATREVFTFTNRKKRRVRYRGKKVSIPDQVSFHTRSSCASQHSEEAFSGTKSYSKELERSVSVSGGLSATFASVEFSLSAGMKSVQQKTEKSKSIIIQKNKLCNYGTVRYLYENAQAVLAGYTLSTSFKNAVLHALPKTYKKSAYMQFIEDWGTHVIVELDVGIRRMKRSTVSYSKVYDYLMKKKSVSGSVSGHYGFYSASASFMVNSLNSNINEETRLGKSLTTITQGTKSLPAPIHLTLKLITDCLDRHWWGKQYGKSRIATKRKYLLKALRDYPKWLDAKKNKDPLIKIVLKWPDGKYALPMTKKGCPNGWHQGWRYQDDENKRIGNKNSKGITTRMRVKITGNSKFYYCVKDYTGNTGFDWPKGSYCIARKGGKCPRGFREGLVEWDDEDHKNKNSRWGILPDGKFDRNTKVEYCCRSDGRPSSPMVLPPDRPFVLYRYGGRCQRVEGMRYWKDWIQWDDEDKNNGSKCKGHHPDANCRKNIKLYFCYYKKK